MKLDKRSCIFTRRDAPIPVFFFLFSFFLLPPAGGGDEIELATNWSADLKFLSPGKRERNCQCHVPVFHNLQI